MSPGRRLLSSLSSLPTADERRLAPNAGYEHTKYTHTTLGTCIERREFTMTIPLHIIYQSSFTASSR